MTGIHWLPGRSVDFVIQTILVMVFNPRLKFFFFYFFFLPLLFLLSEQGNLYAGRIQRGTKEGKTSFSQKRERGIKKKKRMLLAFPVFEGVKPFCCQLCFKG